MMANYWLMKTEPSAYSIDTLEREGKTQWDGVRNYQARNHMMNMNVGDMILFYHSSTDPMGVVGIAKVVSKTHPDTTQFDKKDMHYDPKSKAEKPTWWCPDVAFVEKFKRVVTLNEMKEDPRLAGILVARRGVRLSVQPVSKEHFEYIRNLGK